MEYTYAAPLQPGDTIAVVAPSSTLAGADVTKGLVFLRSLGYELKIGKSVSAFDGYLAGPDRLRAADINDAFADDTVKAIVCLRGGYGATRILPLLDYDLIAAHPKLFVGFSDITALHTAFLQRCGFCPIHGTMVMSLGRDASEYTKEQFAYGLQHPYEARELPLPPDCSPKRSFPVPSRVPWSGVNMMLLSVLMGTPYAIDPPAGAILCLEEVGEDAYALDRMLCQFEEAGLIDRVRAIAFGEFYHCGPDEKAPYEWTVKEVLRAYAKKWGKPAVMDLPFGHGADNAWLPLGQRAGLEARLDGVRFTLL